MSDKRTEFYPSDFDVQSAVTWEFDMRRTEPDKPSFTVPGLVRACCERGNPVSASQVRHLLGWLYGKGAAKVVAVHEGEEVWQMSTPEDRVRR